MTLDSQNLHAAVDELDVQANIIRQEMTSLRMY